MNANPLAPLFAAWAADAARERPKLLPADTGGTLSTAVGSGPLSSPCPQGDLSAKLAFAGATDRVYRAGLGDAVEIEPNTVLCTVGPDKQRRVIREATREEYEDSEPSDGYRENGGVGLNILVCDLCCWVELEGEVDP